MVSSARAFSTPPLARTAAILLLASAINGCEAQIQARLDNSIGIATFDNLGLIEKKPLGVGLAVTDEVRNVTTEVAVQNVKIRMAVGEALISRLMQALVLQFDRVQLLRDPSIPVGVPLDTVMVVNLKGLESSVRFQPLWNTVATRSTGWIELEATLKDRDGQIVWVGTSRVDTEAENQSILIASAQDASAAMNKAIELTVAKLVNQMSISSSLREFIAIRQRRPSV